MGSSTSSEQTEFYDVSPLKFPSDIVTFAMNMGIITKKIMCQANPQKDQTYFIRYYVNGKLQKDLKEFDIAELVENVNSTERTFFVEMVNCLISERNKAVENKSVLDIQIQILDRSTLYIIQYTTIAKFDKWFGIFCERWCGCSLVGGETHRFIPLSLFHDGTDGFRLQEYSKVWKLNFEQFFSYNLDSQTDLYSYLKPKMKCHTNDECVNVEDVPISHNSPNTFVEYLIKVLSNHIRYSKYVKHTVQILNSYVRGDQYITEKWCLYGGSANAALVFYKKYLAERALNVVVNNNSVKEEKEGGEAECVEGDVDISSSSIPLISLNVEMKGTN